MKRLELNGNLTTMNLNNIVYTNILTSPYYKALGEYTSFHEVMDEIYTQVKYLEPFATGSSPSSAYCLLFKLWNLKLTNKQLVSMLDTTDSPYVRAIGLLYLRYATKPNYLYEWFEPYLLDSEPLNLTKGPRPVQSTIGGLCLSLLKDLKFCNTMLPRIPVPIQKVIDVNLAELQPKKEKERYADVVTDRNGSSARERYRDRDHSPPSRNTLDERRYDRERRSRSRYYSRSRSRSPLPRKERERRYRDYDAEPYKKYEDQAISSRRRISYNSRSRSRSRDRKESKENLKDAFGRDMPRKC